MAGYIRQSVANIVNGSNITAPPLNAEFNQLAVAFDPTTGHTHDASAGSSPKIDLTTSITGYLPAIHGGVGGKNNTQATANPTTGDDFNDGYAPGSIWLNSVNGRGFICITNTLNNAVWAEVASISPNNRITAEVSNTVDIGSSVYQFKDIYIDGTGYIDTISGDTATLTSNASVGGNLTLTGNYIGSGNLTNTGTGYFGGNVTTNADLAVNGTLNAAGDVNLGNNTTDTVTFISRVDSSVIPSADGTYNLGSTTQEWQNLYIDGTAEIDQLNADSVDIDNGNIDNTVIGAGTRASGSFTGLTADGTVNFGSATVSNLGTVTTADINGGSIDGVTIGTNSAVTDLRVDNLKVDGNAVTSTNTNGNIDITPNGTGEVNISKVDIDSGTIDNTVIGATTPVAGAFTTVTTTGQATLATADINGGTIDGAVIGANSASSGAFTTVSASGGFTGDITGNITGNTSGTHTGPVVGNVTGDLTGNLTASSGSSTFNNITINGTLDVTSTVISNVSDPVANADAANKGYVDTAISDLIGGAPGALDTLNELADALNDDANAYATLDAKINTKLTKAGDTMSGVLAMGANNITGVSDPTANQDASTKAYTDTQRDTRVSKTGDTMSGVINMGSNKVTNVTDPTSAQDAATKNYIDTIFGSTTAAATSAANAATSETNAATSATNAATSETNAANSATSAATSLDDFTDQYLGPKATAPTVDNDGDALVIGTLYFNTATSTMQVYGSSGWVPAGSSVNGTSERFKYTATAAQTTFSGADDNSNSLAYDSGFLDTYLNGIRLVNGADFTATSGTSLQLSAGASVGDVLEVVTFGTFTLANQSIDDMTDVSIASPSNGQVLKYNGTAWVNGTDEENLEGGVVINEAGADADFRVESDTNTHALFVQGSDGNVGIGDGAPLDKLHVYETSNSAVATQLLLQNEGSGNHSAGIAFQVSASAETTAFAPKAGIVFERTALNGRGALKFFNGDVNDVNGFSAGDERMRINRDGNIGIGTTAVATNFKQEIVGNAGANNTAATSGTTQATSAVMRIRPGGSFTGTLDIGQGGGTGSWLQSTDTANLATTYPLLLNPVGGNVGIGTTAPAGKLHVAGGRSYFAANNEKYGVGARYIDSGGTVYFGATDATSTPGVQISAATGGALMNITTGGNVGIGTTAPVTLKSQKTLQVLGNAKLGSANDTGLLSLGDVTSTDANAGIWRGAAGPYAGGGNYLNLGGYSGIGFTTGAADIASQSRRMLINSAGNILVSKYNGTAASPTESSDWPTPVMALRSYDSSHPGVSMLSFGYSNDAQYQTANPVWNFRLWGTGGDTASSAATDLALIGPGDLALGSNTSETMRLVGNNVGIGTTAPLQKLHISGTDGVGFGGTGAVDKKLYSPADGVLEWMTHTAAGQRGFAVSHQGSKVVYLSASGSSYLNGGNVGIGTTAPAEKLDVTNGSIRMSTLKGGYGNSAGNFHIDSKVGTGGRIYLNWFAGGSGIDVGNGGSGYGIARASAFTVSSDRRLKENISYFDSGLAQILQLKPATFDFINGENNQKGFIAQDVETVIPEAVGRTTTPDSSGEVDEADEYLTLNQSAIIPYLVSAIKEQQTMILALTARITALEGA